MTDAADEIQRVDKMLGDLEEEVAQLRIRRAQEASRKPGIVSPKVLVETIYRENHVRTGFIPTLAPAVPLADGQVAAPETAFLDPVLDSVLTLTQPQDYPCFRATAEKRVQLEGAIKAEIRRRKLQVYYRMRMVGERMAKMVEPEDPQGGNGGSPQKPLLKPGGVMRLQEMASSTQNGNQRWDSNLAREVDMEWNRDHLRYVFDDQSQRVLDPERENAERRAALRWTEEEQKAFIEAYKDYGKEFHVIATKKPFRVSEVAPKTTHEIIAFYYFVKHRINLKQLVSKRGGMRGLPKDRAAMSSSATPIPRELLNLGITSEAEVVAYLMAKSKGSDPGVAATVAAAAAAAASVASAPSSLSDVQVKLEPGPVLSEKRPREEESVIERLSFSSASGAGPAGSSAISAINIGDDVDEAEIGSSVASAAALASVEFAMPEIVLPDAFDASAHSAIWTSLESDIFLEAVGEYGPDWPSLAKDTGKTLEQCAAFYLQHPEPIRLALQRAALLVKVEPGIWSDEDKVAYRQHVTEFGRDWSKLAAVLHKPEEQCRAVWSRFKVRLGLREALKFWEEQQESARPVKALKVEEGDVAGEMKSPPLTTRPMMAETQDAGFLEANK